VSQGPRQVTIENPILNTPFAEPDRHFKFDDDGITNEILEGRRPSSYFIPIPKPRSKGKQLALENDQVEQRRKENKLVGQIRERVAFWRLNNYFGITGTTRKLLDYWTSPTRERKLFFCQIEALETAIFLTEVAEKSDPHLLAQLRVQNLESNPELFRIAFKMATGSGKTVVMAMLIAWQALNKILNKQDARFSDVFLIVSPGITIRDRLRVLMPNDPNNYYRERDLLPPDYVRLLDEAKFVITNFHTFHLRTLTDLSKTGKAVLLGRTKKEEPGIFTESEPQMVRRVLKDLGGKKNIIVLNDEAHHCYRRKADAEVEEGKLSREDKAEVKQREEEARVWISGVEAVKRRNGVRCVYDLSATPFFLKGSGYDEGTLFGWVASDFSLIDAIESGIVKIPRVPVEDNTMQSSGPAYRDLWSKIREELPKKGRGKEQAEFQKLPKDLEGALESLYGNYKKSFERWDAAKSEDHVSSPPVFIVVCNNTNVSNLVYQYIAGYDKPQPDGTTKPAPGKFSLFSNVKDREWLHRPNTILVDSQELESGEMSDDFKKIASREIEEFKREYRNRYPDRDADKVSDAEMLREVMNTVGKPGKLGGDVRCVVSVSMLTEGWDANTVTHILGVRAFGTQLLCEQVVGRGLRRKSYAVNEHGMFEPEYAEVYGVPFSFIPTAAAAGEIKDERRSTRVRTLEERADLKITYPRLLGYRYELPQRRLSAKFTKASEMTIASSEVATWTDVSGVVGEAERHDLDWYKTRRMQKVEFELARTSLERYFRKQIETNKEEQPVAEVGEMAHDGKVREFVDATLFPQVLRITKDWIGSSVKCEDDTFPQLLLLSPLLDRAADKIYHAILSESVGDKRILPRMFDYDPIGSTEHVDFDTVRPTYRTTLSHVSHVVCDTNSWEQKMAQVLEATEGLISYVKNDHLGFAIPYTYEGKEHSYYPDFIARIKQPDGSILNLIIEVSGEDLEEKAMKVAMARDFWVPAVNNAGRFGTWAITEVKNPSKEALRYE
jgi:type III restriction enzyme